MKQNVPCERPDPQGSHQVLWWKMFQDIGTVLRRQRTSDRCGQSSLMQLVMQLYYVAMIQTLAGGWYSRDVSQASWEELDTNQHNEQDGVQEFLVPLRVEALYPYFSSTYIQYLSVKFMRYVWCSDKPQVTIPRALVKRPHSHAVVRVMRRGSRSGSQHEHLNGRKGLGTVVQEEDLANVMKLHPKQLRRTLRFLEQDMMVRRWRFGKIVLQCEIWRTWLH